MPRCSSPRRSSTGNHPLIESDQSSRPFRRFIIFGAGRCGSSLLVDLLNSQPSVNCDFFLPEQASDPYSGICSRAALARSQGASAYGVRLLLPHLMSAGLLANAPELLSHACADGWSVIHTRRASLLRAAISYIYAIRQGFHLMDGDGPRRFEPIAVDLEELSCWLALVTQWAEIEHRVLDGTSYLEVVYENSLASEVAQLETINQVMNFLLGAEAVPAHTKFRRQLPAAGLQNFILNYSEMMEFIEEKGIADLVGS